MIHSILKFFLLLVFTLPLMTLGQSQSKINSLNNLLTKSSADTNRCNILSHLFTELIRKDIDKAAALNEQSLVLARKINYPKGIAEAIYNQSSVFRLKGKYDSAMALMERSRPLFKNFPDKLMYADYLGDLGSIYSLKNDPKNALINFMEALKIFRATGIKKNLSLLYNRFGTLYQTQKQYDSALVYYQKSLEINNATGFKLGSSVNLTNIGIIYVDKGDHLKAIEYTQKAYEIKEKLGDKQGLEKCLNNIGTSYMNLGKVQLAIQYHEKALALAEDYKSNLDIARAYTNLGFDYQKGNNFNNAIEYALKGLKEAKQINDIKLLRETSRVLFESYASLKKFEEAYNYHLMFKQYSDSIENEDQMKAMSEIQTKYNVATKEKEITDLTVQKKSQELQIQTLRAWYSLAIGSFVAMIGLALFFYYRSRVSRKLSEKLEEINEMKSHFFANLSHEFRTPLTLMLGPTEKLLATASDIDKPWLELIHRNASRLLFLDEQLLEFTRIDSGSQKIKLLAGNILIPVRSIAESFVYLAEKQNINFTFLLPEEPMEVCFDADILEKVTGNLLSNAFKYTNLKGSVELKVTEEEISTEQSSSKENQGLSRFVRIDVADTGIGIPENKQEQIFDRFYQLNHNLGNTVGGYGIGLALTRELLNLHHGFIRLKSDEGNGSLFSVFLPLENSAYSETELKELKPYMPEMRRVYEQISPEGKGSFSVPDLSSPQESPDEDGQFHILVVDDNSDMRHYIKEILLEQYIVTDADNGKSGFEEACNLLPDLIITDVMMHPVNGIEFCRNIKTDERTSHIPVIMLTALSGSREKIEGLETGVDDYLTKPFSTRELIIRIQNLIEQRIRLRQVFSSNLILGPKAISVTSSDEKFLIKLISLIEENIDNPELDNEFLLQNIAMSRSQLHRKIKALSGQPITGFVRVIRIKRAAQLMELKFGNVSDIMYAVGFNNQSYFTKCFREVYSVTPSDYMANHPESQLKQQNIMDAT